MFVYKGRYYKLNIVETFYDESNAATADFCNICRLPINLGDIPVESYDVTEMPEYWNMTYTVYKANGSKDLDIYIEGVTMQHLQDKHQDAIDALDSSTDEATIRRFIGDKFIGDDD